MKQDVLRKDVESAIQTACKHAEEKDNVKLSDESKIIIGAEVLCQKLFGQNISKFATYDENDPTQVHCMIYVNYKQFLGIGESKIQARYRACKKFYNHFVKTLK